MIPKIVDADTTVQESASIHSREALNQSARSALDQQIWGHRFLRTYITFQTEEAPDDPAPFSLITAIYTWCFFLDLSAQADSFESFCLTAVQRQFASYPRRFLFLCG